MGNSGGDGRRQSDRSVAPPATVDLRSTMRGVLLAVRAQPGARRNAITGVHAGALKVAVTAPPDKGKANEAIVALLCEKLQLGRGQIALVAGETSRQKKFEVAEVDADALRRRIEACLATIS